MIKITKKKTLGWPIKNHKISNFLSPKKLNYNEIKRVLDNVSNCNQFHWEKKYYRSIKDLMYFDKNNSQIRNVVTNILKKYN